MLGGLRVKIHLQNFKAAKGFMKYKFWFNLDLEHKMKTHFKLFMQNDISDSKLHFLKKKAFEQMGANMYLFKIYIKHDV